MERSSSSFDGNVNLQIMRNILANEITKVQTRDVLNKISEQQDNENNKHQRNINTNANMNMNSNTCSNMNNNNNSNNKYTNHTQDTTSILDYSFLNKPTQDINITSLITNVNTGRNNRSKSNTKMNNHIQFSNNTNNNNNYNTTNPIISDNTTYNPSSKRSHSKDIYSKQMALKLKTEMKLDEIRKRNNEEEMKHLQQKPIINNKSKQICKKKGKTFLERLNEEQNKKLINQQHKLINNNNKPPLPKKQIRSKEEFDKWIERNEKWNHERKVKIEHLKNAIQILEDDSEDLTFCPAINKNSKCIVEEKGQIPINERIEGIIETKNSYVKRKQQEILPSFTPRINTSYKISEEYYDFMKDDQEEIYNSLRRE